MDKLSQKIDMAPAPALIVIGCLAQAMIGVFVKYLVQTDLGIYNQILLKNIIAGLLGLVFVAGSMKAHFNSTSRDKFIILLRSFIYITGIYFFTLALKYTTVANVGLVSAFPFVAIFGALFFKEKIDFKEIIFLITAFFGVLVVAGFNLKGLSLGIGEIYAFIFAALFAVMYVLAKKTTSNISAQQYSALTQVLVAPFIITISLLNNGLNDISTHFSLYVLLLAFGAGLFIIVNMIAIGSAMRRSKSVSANTLMYSYPVFSVLASLAFFKDVPKLNELIGGVIILVSCILITISQSKLNLNKEK